MSGPTHTRPIHWLNRCAVALAVAVAGGTVAVMYLIVPALFWLVVGLFVLKGAVELLLWSRLSDAERDGYAPPFHLMNRNFVLSVRAEWALFAAGFLGLVGWVEFGRFAGG